MSMHLVGPWLSTTGKRKSKRKFRTAAAAAAAREQSEAWEDLKKRHGVEQQQRQRKRGLTSPVYSPKKLSYRGSELPRIPSLPFTGDACFRAEDKVYTGDKILGIGTMHKSNAVPIFSDEEAKSISKMRRG